MQKLKNQIVSYVVEQVPKHNKTPVFHRHTRAVEMQKNIINHISMYQDMKILYPQNTSHIGHEILDKVNNSSNFLKFAPESDLLMTERDNPNDKQEIKFSIDFVRELNKLHDSYQDIMNSLWSMGKVALDKGGGHYLPNVMKKLSNFEEIKGMLNKTCGSDALIKDGLKLIGLESPLVDGIVDNGITTSLPEYWPILKHIIEEYDRIITKDIEETVEMIYEKDKRFVNKIASEHHQNLFYSIY